MKWFIVESPNKTKTISNILKKITDIKFNVLASYGHIKQAKSITVNNDGQFIICWTEKEYYTKLKNKLLEISNNDEVYLFTDPDREGEAIAHHINELVQIINKNINIYRISTNEITENGVKQALLTKKQINHFMLNAYYTRITLDYIVGFTISPILWKKLIGCKSAGRVQSVVLQIINQREIEISNFIPEKYYQIIVNTTIDDVNFENINIIDNIKDIDNIKEIINNTYKTDTKQIEKIENAPTVFNTASIQTFCFNTFHFNVNKTMQILQKLYEGIKIEDQHISLITYHRTDSYYINKIFIEEMKQYIKQEYGQEYVSTIEHNEKKNINAQEAHEGIRPTDINITIEKAEKYLDKNQLKIYKAIYERTLGSVMSNAIYHNTIVTFQHNHITFKTQKLFTIHSGFRILYKYNMQKSEQYDKDKVNNYINSIKEITIKDIEVQEKYTLPKSRYNEGSIVKKMEENGIGRPSTYAYIINVLKNRSYIYTNHNIFIPKNRSRLLCSFLDLYFNTFINKDFTNIMELNLDKIANNEICHNKIIKQYNDKLLELSNIVLSINRKDILLEIEKNITKFIKCKKNQEHTTVLKFNMKKECYMSCTDKDCDFTSNLY